MDGWLSGILGNMSAGIYSSSQDQAQNDLQHQIIAQNPSAWANIYNIQHPFLAQAQQNMQGGQSFHQQLQANINTQQQQLLQNPWTQSIWQQTQGTWTFETPEQRHKREFKEKIDVKVDELLSD